MFFTQFIISLLLTHLLVECEVNDKNFISLIIASENIMFTSYTSVSE
jgi:hypothetical protein